CAPIRSQRLLRLRAIAHDVSEVEPHERRVRKTHRQSLKHRFGFVEFRRHRECRCTADVNLRFMWRETACLPERLFRVVIAAERKIALAEVREQVRVGTLTTGRALEVAHGLSGLPKLEERRSEEFERVSV